MKKEILAALAALAAANLVHAVEPAAKGAAVVATVPGKGVVAGAVEVRAKVLDVDLPNRVVTLKRPDGNVVTVTAGEEVRNLPQVKVGDDVVVRYLQALALELKKGGGVRETVEREDAFRAKPGEKPAGGVAREIEFVADVVAVDKKKQIVTLKGAKGRVVDLKLQDPEQIKTVKKGDQVAGIYSEAVAISVEPAPKAAPKK